MTKERRRLLLNTNIDELNPRQLHDLMESLNVAMIDRQVWREANERWGDYESAEECGREYDDLAEKFSAVHAKINSMRTTNAGEGPYTLYSYNEAGNRVVFDQYNELHEAMNRAYELETLMQSKSVKNATWHYWNLSDERDIAHEWEWLGARHRWGIEYTAKR